MKREFIYAIRSLARKPIFAIAAVLTLALGIGANTAIFSVVNAVLLRPLPYPSPDRLMMLWTYNARQGFDKDVSAYPNFDDWRRQNTSFDRMTAYFGADFTLTQAGEPAQIRGVFVTPEFFETLGVDPERGRAFSSREGTADGARVAILSHSLWETRFGSNTAITGRSIVLNGISHEILGVMPASFAYPETAQVWVPLAPTDRFAELMQSRGSFWLQVIGRLKQGVTRDEAQSEMNAIASALERQYPNVNAGAGVRLVPMRDEIVGDVRRPLLVLLAAVGFVLLIACANVANLLLTRAASRQKEFAIRAALGAGRSRLVRQMLIESLVLAAAGGVAGLLLASGGIQALQALAPPDLPRLKGVRIDTPVILYTSLAVLVTGLIFGAAPALHSSATPASESLKEGGRTGSEGSRGRRLRDAVAIVEMAVALVLLIGAGLLVRSFIALNKVELGFDTRNTLALRLNLPRAQYPQGAQVAAFYSNLASRLSALPGVENVALGSSVLLSALPQSASLTVEGRPAEAPGVLNPPVAYDSISPEFFKTLRIPLRSGRLFTDADAPTSQPVVIVNEALVRRFFPGGDALNKRLTFGNPSDSRSPWATIVGVVADTRRGGVNRAPWAEVYFPHAQAPDSRMYVLVRTTGDPVALSRSAREGVWAIDPNQPIQSTRTVDALLAGSQASRRFIMLVLGLFSIIALLLATIGIYGVAAYSTAQRTQEIGIRMALGARRADVLTMVLKQAVVIGGVAVLIGITAAFLLTNFMSGLLFGVGVHDPITFVALPLGLLLVAGLATLIPAVRAIRINPVVALRAE